MGRIAVLADFFEGCVPGVTATAREAIRAELAALLSSHDVLVAPAVGSEAPLLSAAAARGGELDLAGMGKLAAVAFPGNLTGLSCCAVPCAKSGAPVGLQILGRPGDEGTVLAAARVVESVCAPRKPPLWRA
jgi:Asp-tRNA(Asn)/Glu-tRNA(Gln) amidotransferase A subunit family amidase